MKKPTKGTVKVLTSGTTNKNMQVCRRNTNYSLYHILNLSPRQWEASLSHRERLELAYMINQID